MKQPTLKLVQQIMIVPTGVKAHTSEDFIYLFTK